MHAGAFVAGGVSSSGRHVGDGSRRIEALHAQESAGNSREAAVVTTRSSTTTASTVPRAEACASSTTTGAVR